ncbi:MAG: hypothetical protein IK134_05880 [Oscillospiraceae bacterium]|nr:hypothetical protein [Oscillospiraceae bacterium]
MPVRRVLKRAKSKYRVIRIMSDMSILLNCGTYHNIQIGDQFRIMSNEVEQIVDPFSNEILGVIHKYKAEIEVTQVYERMCVCQNAKRSASISDAALAISRSMSIGTRLRLNVDPEQISGGFKAENDELIQIGDEVELIPRPQDPANQDPADQNDQEDS